MNTNALKHMRAITRNVSDEMYVAYRWAIERIFRLNCAKATKILVANGFYGPGNAVAVKGITVRMHKALTSITAFEKVDARANAIADHALVIGYGKELITGLGAIFDIIDLGFGETAPTEVHSMIEDFTDSFDDAASEDTQAIKVCMLLSQIESYDVPQNKHGKDIATAALEKFARIKVSPMNENASECKRSPLLRDISETMYVECRWAIERILRLKCADTAKIIATHGFITGLQRTIFNKKITEQMHTCLRSIKTSAKSSPRAKSIARQALHVGFEDELIIGLKALFAIADLCVDSSPPDDVRELIEKFTVSFDDDVASQLTNLKQLLGKIAAYGNGDVPQNYHAKVIATEALEKLNGIEMTIKDRIKAIVDRELGGTAGIGAQALLEIVELVPLPALVVTSLGNFASAFAERTTYEDMVANIIGMLEWLECYGNGNLPGNSDVNTIASCALHHIRSATNTASPDDARTGTPGSAMFEELNIIAPKPPIGLVPLQQFTGTRLARRISILKAMLRYSEVDTPIPNAWITELATHLNPVHVKLSRMTTSSGVSWWVSLVRAVDLGADSFSANIYTVYTSEKYEQAVHEAKDYAEFFGTEVIIACAAPPMTLDEAIEHAKQKGCGQDRCSAEHQQLAVWLTELKNLKAKETTTPDR